MPVDFGEKIAGRALSLIGVQFRLHGRQPDVGLDCVGVVLEALSATGQIADVRMDYRLRGDHYPLAFDHFDGGQFIEVSSACSKAGDLQLLQPGIRQLHFAVLTRRGAVHAHAGLRRVVLTPLPLPWPVLGQWRFIGG